MTFRTIAHSYSLLAGIAYLLAILFPGVTILVALGVVFTIAGPLVALLFPELPAPVS